eukprot:CAMPEP_0197600308 /NCGR_PEP_ID=MMETSP1326-20131121/33035_1 /TAXON_ID=1155430 /ORGANISM="Genus nov. species nov., Strain RCC2288" /LENGTH=180 /DNA_ID=CAMNT_0043167395 /DNA_START=1 /DNA_END=543 /DNA_ORIENTATION=+
MPAGEVPITRKRAVTPRADESKSWNFLSGSGPSAPSAPSTAAAAKPFKPGWKERRKEDAIQPAAQRHESEVRIAARTENHSKMRYDVIADRRDYTGVDPIKGTVRDAAKAVPQSLGRRTMPMRSLEVIEREARKAVSADVRQTLRRDVIVNEGLGGAVAKGARVRDNFDASLYNPQARFH